MLPSSLARSEPTTSGCTRLGRASSSRRAPDATAAAGRACDRAGREGVHRDVTVEPCARQGQAHDRRRTCMRCRAGGARSPAPARPPRGRGRRTRTPAPASHARPATTRPGDTSTARASRRQTTASGSRDAPRGRARAGSRRGDGHRPTYRPWPAAEWPDAACRTSSAWSPSGCAADERADSHREWLRLRRRATATARRRHPEPLAGGDAHASAPRTDGPASR